MALSENDIANALGQKLATLSPLPLIVWENRIPRDASGTPYETIPNERKPYLDVEIIPTLRRDVTLKGGGVRAVSEGYLQVIAVSKQDEFAVAARQLVDRVLALFPAALRLDVNGGGKIVIEQTVNLIPGFLDGDDWRQGVRINYTARS